MVNFSIFNELSLPLNQHEAVDTFIQFFKLLEELKQNRLNMIRMSHDFKDYTLFNDKDITLQQFLGQQTDRDFKRRLRSFITNQISVIETPIIKKEEREQQNEFSSCEYFYCTQSTDNGLACCDIWNTLAVSFSTKTEWDNDLIPLKKEILTMDGEIKNQSIQIKHASKKAHLAQHQDFFKKIQEEQKRQITQRNFWQNRLKHFSEIIEFCPEVESQIIKLDKKIFQQAISILRDIETKQKLISDFDWSAESKSVRKNPKLADMRKFMLLGKKTFFENHIKNFSNNYRMYFFEKENKIYIGYIGKHLPT